MLRTRKQIEPENKKVHVRKNDEVVVLAGKDRGKRGKVLRVFPSKNAAIVERVNFVKKHTRKNPQKNVQGGILERESPIRVDKLMVICPACGEPSRLGHRRKDGEVVRYCKKCEADLNR